MKLDRDLRIQWLVAAAFVGVNLAVAVSSAIGGQYFNALAALVWSGCNVLWAATARNQQRTRDLSRRADDEISRVLGVVREARETLRASRGDDLTEGRWLQ